MEERPGRGGTGECRWCSPPGSGKRGDGSQCTMCQGTGRRDEPAPADRPVVNIVGDHVALGPVHRDLEPAYHRWLNDFATLRTMGMVPRPLTAEQTAADIAQDSGGANNAVFVIYEVASWRAIGVGGWSDIDWRNRTADLVLAIWEPAYRGRGYGTEATTLLLDHAFTALGLHSAGLRVDEFNLAGIRAYRKAGFRECGRRRECRWMGGRLWDELAMDCLASEFVSPVLGRVFVPDEPRA
ncbi:MAG TPA: GNAT family N-acetyltransferase [Thermomicrobiales bacterium]|nr:GNAT family N-acetyltransferase [Thermomicrobiales bacterium]